jgi:uncharacterized membrane protein YoaK (UPF0700 family)
MDDRRLPSLLLALTVVTGLVDAVSYLGLGRVFVANMTGNVVFLGFASAGAQGFAVVASLVAIAAFMIGAAIAGRLWVQGTSRGVRYVARVATTELVLVVAATATALWTNTGELFFQCVLVVLLGLAMGLQNAAARALAIPDLTTTVLTLTITGIASDSALAGGANPRIGRRVLAVALMFAGALAGAFLLLQWGAAAALATTAVLLAAIAAAAILTRAPADAAAAAPP